MIRCIRKFHVVVVQWTSKKCTKKGCTCRAAVVLLIKPIAFWHFLCRRRRGGWLSSLTTTRKPPYIILRKTIFTLSTRHRDNCIKYGIWHVAVKDNFTGTHFELAVPCSDTSFFADRSDKCQRRDGNASNWWWSATDHGKEKNQRRPFSPSRLPLRPNVHRDIETSGYEAAFENVVEIVVIS